MRQHPIVVTESDSHRLRGLLGGFYQRAIHDQDHLRGLQAELERALVVKATDVPAGVITMHSRVRVLDRVTGRRSEYVLTYPADANVGANRISVLAPLGTALLGYSEGDEVEWFMPGGLRRLRIEQVDQSWEENSAYGSSERAPSVLDVAEA